MMSSSEEDDSMLRAAVDPKFASCFERKDGQGQNCNGQSNLKDSKDLARNHTTARNESTTDSDYLDQGMTPEFKNFIAKKLSKILDSRIKVRDVHQSSPVTESPPEDSNGIRLFASSKHIVNCDENEGESPCQKRRKPDLLKKSKKRKKRTEDGSSSSSSEDEMAKLASVAVSSDWVMTKKGVYDCAKSAVDAEEADQSALVPNRCGEEGGDTEKRSSHHRNVCRKKKHKDTEEKEQLNKKRRKIRRWGNRSRKRRIKKEKEIQKNQLNCTDVKN